METIDSNYFLGWCKTCHYMLSKILRIEGWGFVSSLNENIMSFQKEELSLHRLSTMFEPRDKIIPIFWNLRPMELLERSYKKPYFIIKSD